MGQVAHGWFLRVSTGTYPLRSVNLLPAGSVVVASSLNNLQNRGGAVSGWTAVG